MTSNMNKLLLIVFLLALFGTFIHFAVEPFIPVAHAQEPVQQLSDYQQEHEYCQQFSTKEKPVIGGTREQIINHCKKFTN